MDSIGLHHMQTPFPCTQHDSKPHYVSSIILGAGISALSAKITPNTGTSLKVNFWEKVHYVWHDPNFLSTPKEAVGCITGHKHLDNTLTCMHKVIQCSTVCPVPLNHFLQVLGHGVVYSKLCNMVEVPGKESYSFGTLLLGNAVKLGKYFTPSHIAAPERIASYAGVTHQLPYSICLDNAKAPHVD